MRNGKRGGMVQRYKCAECGSQNEPIIVAKLGDDEEVLKENIILAKQKQKLQDKSRVERKSFRELARIENAVEEYVKKLRDIIGKKSFPKKVAHKISSPSTMIIHLSDLHFNEMVNIVGNSYDFQIASKRLYKFADKTLQYAKVHNIKQAHIVITGDLLNSDRRLDEILTMSTNRAKATFLATKLIAQFINMLNDHLNLKVISVTGNESRIREEYTFIDELATDNFDFMIYEILKLLYQHNKSVEFISGDCFEYIFSINNATFLLCHGDKLGKMQSTDISKTFAKWSRKGVIIDMILCGHLHETKITDSLGRCGSLVGNNAYADQRLNLYGRASQNLYIVYADSTVDSVRVDLQKVDTKSKMFEIDHDMEAYNAKSLTKTKNNVVIFKTVI